MSQEYSISLVDLWMDIEQKTTNDFVLRRPGKVHVHVSRPKTATWTQANADSANTNIIFQTHLAKKYCSKTGLELHRDFSKFSSAPSCLVAYGFWCLLQVFTHALSPSMAIKYILVHGWIRHRVPLLHRGSIFLEVDQSAVRVSSKTRRPFDRTPTPAPPPPPLSRLKFYFHFRYNGTPWEQTFQNATPTNPSQRF